MNDFFDDFDNDYDGGSDDGGDEGECDDDISDFETDGDDDDTTYETTDGSWDFPREKDWSIIGPLSEELTRERREKDRIQRDYNIPDDDYGTLSTEGDEDEL